MLAMGDVMKRLRNAMKTSGKTRYQLWKETGIDQSHLAKLLHGEVGLSVENLERLAAALDLEIVIRPAKRKRPQTRER
jgi:transcriptional regulator with XRE-family HTH domain